MSEYCSECGDLIPTDEWHPVETRREDDGTVTIHDFCAESCLSAWQTDEDATTNT